jgi:hypothetical protein
VRVSHDSYQDAEVRAKPQDTEVIVTLTPRQMIELRIVDAVTGKPVPGCQVLRGEAFRDKDNSRERTAWPGNPARAADAQGVYQEGISDPKELVVYRITAAGYTPLVTRALSPANAVLTETIKLQRAMPLLVRIVQQDGQPAQKANVYAILRANGLVLESVTERRPAEHYENPLEASLSADKDGRCALPSLQDDTVILVVHESGFAYAYWRDVPRGTDWKLGPWARAEATVADGGKPVAGASYTYQGGMVLPGQRWVSMVLKVTSDAQGKIVLPQVFPAMQAHFAENIPVPVDKTGQGRTGRISSVGERMQEYEMKTTRAGETTRFDLRPAAGRTWTVTGRFVMENAADKKEPFPKGFILTKEHANQGSTTGINIAAVNSDGTFEAGPLTAGAYQLGLWDDDKTHFSLKQPALTLPEPPVGATQEQRRRDIGDVVLISLNSPTAKLGAPKGRARFRVMVQDEKGQPVAGARISVAAFRSKEESGVTFALPDTFPDLAGKQVTADASGVAEIECSATSKQGRTLTELQLIVMGDGVVGNFAAFAKANVISTFILKRAGTIVAQIMWQGKTVEGEGVHLLTSKAGSDADAGFTRQADGTYVNRSLRLGPVLVQAAWKTPDGSLVFSDAMPVTVTDGSIVNCTLNLKPGQRLQGRLDAKVPRPVKDARIGACVLHVVQGQNGKISESGARIVWLDRTEVREDGSFEFASLPPGPVHVVVLGDGWISTHRQDAWGIVRPLPLTMPLTGEVVIPMEHTATCEVVVQSSKGEPIQGASVFVSPNLNWDGTGNGLLDLYLPTLQETLSKSLNSKERPSPYQTWRSHHAVTDATGKATLTNLPGGQHYVQVYPKAWKAGSVTQPIAQENSDNIELGKTGRLLIRVKE